MDEDVPLYKDAARTLCVLALTAVLAFPVVASDDESRKVVTIATGDWQPYVDSKEVDFGPMGRIIKTAFARAGYDVSYHVFPWTRNAMTVASGDFDAMMPYYCSSERAEKFICSQSIVEGEQVFFHRADMPFEWTTINDLSGYGIGATLGYFYGQAFEKAEKQQRVTVIRIAEDEANLKLLMRGRIDLYPQDRAVGYGMIRVLFPEALWGKLIHHPQPLHTQPLHLLFSRATDRGQALTDTFNTELDAMRVNGELDALLSPIYADQRAVTGSPTKAELDPVQ